jgi:hypothetical protein
MKVLALTITLCTWFFHPHVKKGFADVPSHHWASTATSELKDAGILHGYPDGLFHG